MNFATHFDTDLSDLCVAAVCSPLGDQKQRILFALAIDGDCLPFVSEATLRRYYEYLSANLSLPLRAHYPEPKTPREEDLYECTVVELLDPSQCIGDEFDGIFCKTVKAGFEVNLPLIDLQLRKDSGSFQMIEDYWYWFWNWRAR